MLFGLHYMAKGDSFFLSPSYVIVFSLSFPLSNGYKVSFNLQSISLDLIQCETFPFSEGKREVWL